MSFLATLAVVVIGCGTTSLIYYSALAPEQSGATPGVARVQILDAHILLNPINSLTAWPGETPENWEPLDERYESATTLGYFIIELLAETSVADVRLDLVTATVQHTNEIRALAGVAGPYPPSKQYELYRSGVIDLEPPVVNLCDTVDNRELHGQALRDAWSRFATQIEFDRTSISLSQGGTCYALVFPGPAPLPTEAFSLDIGALVANGEYHRLHTLHYHPMVSRRTNPLVQ